MPNRRKIFSLTSKDFEWDTFRAGGAGGQNQNKRETGVRCRHVLSGAVGESREHRTQGQNKKAAFRRCAESKEFQSWCKLTASSIDIKAIEKLVDESMHEDNLLIEYF